MSRMWLACACVIAAFAVARPALAYSLVSLEPNEREAMLTSCQRLGGTDRTLCRNVVDDRRVVANYKRSCLQAMTLLMQGSTWARVKSLRPTLACREGLAQAGYPVKEIMHKLTAGAR